MTLKVGDVVVLKSGGPKMTVTEVYGNEYVKTFWFIDGVLKWGEFISGALEIAT